MFKNTSSMSYLARIRRTTKNYMQRLPTRHGPIVVASFGRAGSTLVYDAVVEAMSRKRFGTTHDFAQRIIRDVAYDRPPKKFRAGAVYKTHLNPEILSGKGLRAIFMFGSAENAALSVHAQIHLKGEDWVKQHFKHLQRAYRIDRILQEDVLGFQDQCAAWMGYQHIPVLCLRYETLWNNLDKLSAFCNLDIALPQYRQRTQPKLELHQKEHARSTYQPLDNILAKLPNCFIADPKFSHMITAR